MLEEYDLVLGENPAEYAAKLYEALHSFDELGVNEIYVEEIPWDDEWLAVRDRLLRASMRDGS